MTKPSNTKHGFGKLEITALGTVGGLAGENRGELYLTAVRLLLRWMFMLLHKNKTSEQQSKPLSSVVDDDELEPVPEPEPLLSISLVELCQKHSIAYVCTRRF